MRKTSAKLSSAVKNKIWINKWLNLEFPYFFNALCTFWQNSILFQGLENRFHNSVLSIPRGNPDNLVESSFFLISLHRNFLKSALRHERAKCLKLKANKKVVFFFGMSNLAQHAGRVSVKNEHAMQFRRMKTITTWNFLFTAENELINAYLLASHRSCHASPWRWSASSGDPVPRMSTTCDRWVSGSRLSLRSSFECWSRPTKPPVAMETRHAVRVRRKHKSQTSLFSKAMMTHRKSVCDMVETRGIPKAFIC